MRYLKYLCRLCDYHFPRPSWAIWHRLTFAHSIHAHSVDARGASLYTGEHWADVEHLGDRASLKVQPGYQGLHLTRLELEDAGEYRCRVDFKASPTRNLRINLEIIGLFNKLSRIKWLPYIESSDFIYLSIILEIIYRCMTLVI